MFAENTTILVRGPPITFVSTVEPPYATTSRKRTPLISEGLNKTPNFPSQSLTVGTSRERPPPLRDRDHSLGLKVK